MPIKVKTPSATLSTTINREIDAKVKSVIINTLKYVGERCVKEAREGGTYQDQTGNLRSSIGYAIVDDGRVVSDGLNAQFQQFKDGAQGVEEAKKYLYEVGTRFKGTALIVVAGMKYAYYVEKIHNRVVLSSAELLADQLVPQLLTQLGFIVKK